MNNNCKFQKNIIFNLSFNIILQLNTNFKNNKNKIFLRII